MLQLIGWLGCLYLLVKGFEFIGNSGYRDQNNNLRSAAILAVVIAWVGAAAFFLLFTVAGYSSPSVPTTPDISDIESRYPERSAEWQNCVTAAKDAVEAAACKGL